MKFKLLIFILFIFSCSTQLKTVNQKKQYSTKVFAYIYINYNFHKKHKN